MSYISEYRNDVFISYAHMDNDSGPTGVKWVSQFAGYLGTCIRQRLGCGDDLRIFVDNRDLHMNQDVQSLIEEVRHSAIFVAVSSPSYVKREWTRSELDAFTSLPCHEERLFAVEMLPLDQPKDYPDALFRKPRAKFWYVAEEESHASMTLDPALDQRIFVQKLINLSAQIRNQLVKMHDQPDQAFVPGGLLRTGGQAGNAGVGHAGHDSQPDSDASGEHINGTVLLSQVTEELEWEREQVRTFLQQMKIRVLPEIDYPQGGEEFRHAFASDLTEANLVVQLMGRAVGRRPPDLPAGYTRHQFDTANASCKPMLMWRHPETDVASIQQEDQRELLLSPCMIASGLESFKSEVLHTLKSLMAPKRVLPQSLVYVSVDRSDLEIAQALQTGLADANFPVVLPTFDGNSEDIRQDMEENLLESESLVFVHGNAPSTWLRSNLRRLHKLLATRETPPERVAVYLAPPPDKPDVGFSLPYVEIVDSRNEIQVEPLIDFLSRHA